MNSRREPIAERTASWLSVRNEVAPAAFDISSPLSRIQYRRLTEEQQSISNEERSTFHSILVVSNRSTAHRIANRSRYVSFDWDCSPSNHVNLINLTPHARVPTQNSDLSPLVLALIIVKYNQSHSHRIIMIIGPCMIFDPRPISVSWDVLNRKFYWADLQPVCSGKV